MEKHSSTHDIPVVVTAGSTYYLSVVIGNGQTGGSTFTDLAGQIITPEITNALLADGAVLKDMSLYVNSEVMQVNPDDLTLIVSYYVTDHMIANFDQETPVASITFEAGVNDTVSFDTNLKFK